MDIEDTLKTALIELGIQSTSNQLEALKRYLDIIFNYNKRINLTGTKKKEDILIRHILDSISLLKYKIELFDRHDTGSNDQKILDLGTGAGLPGIPLSIFLTNRIFYLLDSSLKKTDFLEMVKGELNLKNVRIIRGRAEELGARSDYRESFDIVLARAVANIRILNELSIPFCKINGKIVFYKSRKIDAELEEGRESILKLGGNIEDLLEVRVPFMNEKRIFLVINKIKETPGLYPRSFNKIKNNPL
ncbi:MAG: 16S rRNA (guanine(527)-N(7))-methyltransferase RsmG [Actinomycetota bacterium]|nr:16S rRNA (guanine(527)-N(7))-methyltransferase RsmG [Actinomycetota bacterium]